ncbi:hypothetical protein AXK59_15970 [Tsukamurella tyrosinosolvens]|nr:hypothetical protein AXK59_15970 [Tsukamurella tyrosinosolvens]
MNFAIGDFDPADRAGAVYLQEDGIQIFPDDGKVLFVEFSAQAAMVIPADRIVDTVKAYAVSRHLSSPRVQKASELYGDAAFQASPMSQIVMLTAAVEALSEKQRRSDAECTLIDEMILMVDEADVEIESGERLKNALRGLKDESVRAAAKRICSTLDQEYNSMSPKKYFDHAYNVRSSLAHGGSGFDRTIVGGTASVLEVFVSDLISSVSAHEAPD